MSSRGRFAAAVSEHPTLAHATGEVIGQVIDGVGVGPELAVLFVSRHHLDRLHEVIEAVQSMLGPRVLIGASGHSVIGNAREVEDRPALSLWAGHIPAVVPFHLDATRSDSGWAITGFPAEVSAGTVLLLADPFSFPVEGLLPQLHERLPDVGVVGGLASASAVPNGNRLVLDTSMVTSGAVGVVVAPGVIETVVSQGCRPIGEPFIVTGVDGRVITHLGGRPAATRLHEMLEALDDESRALAARGLHAGVVVDERRLEFSRGDFLIRGVLGIDVARQGVAIGAAIDVGQTVQFQVRDARTASEDLRHLLANRTSSGALLFTCNGRGSGLFGVDDHDASTAHELLGAPALAGMSCAGEIGPVGRTNHLHGFTASLALFGSN